MKRSMKVAATAAAVAVSLAGGPATAALEAGPEQSGGVDVQAVQGEYSLQAETGVRIRTRPVGNATVVGKGYYGQGATIHCYRVTGGYMWYHHTNNTTGKKGWSNAGYMFTHDQLYRKC